MKQDAGSKARSIATRIRSVAEIVRQPAARALGTALSFASSSWLGLIVATGPEGDADFDDERYWVRELVVLGAPQGKWCVAQKHNGRHVCATHITEMGCRDVFDADAGSGVTMSEDNDPCTQFVPSGSGSVEETGRTYDGDHLILRAPSRLVYDVQRIVLVSSFRASNGTICYWFATNPAAIVPESYGFDATCLDAGCPDGRWWRGYCTGFAAVDDDAGDEMPGCET